MTDSMSTPEVVTTPPRKKSSNGWLIVTGILIIALCASWGINAIRMQRQQKDFRNQLAASEQRHEAAIKTLMEAKALSLASALQMINPNLLSDSGQKDAQPLFVDLLKDPNIAYIALLDNTGNVTATTDLRLARDAAAADTSRITKPQLSKNPTNGADIEAVGPITTADGEQIGIARVGILLKAAPSKK